MLRCFTRKTNPAFGEDSTEVVLKVWNVMLLSRVMKKGGMGWLLFALMATGAGCAQTNAKELQKKLKGKALGLRSYSAEPVAHYDWTDGNIVAVPGKTFAVSLFTTSSVQLKDGVVTLTGKRALVVRDPKKGNLALTAGVPMRLEVDLHGTPEPEVLPKIREMLFSEDLTVLISDLPAALKELKEEFDIAEDKAGAGCGCTQILEDDLWIDVETKGNADYTFPRVSCQAEPEHREEARTKKVSRSVVLAVNVDDRGRVGNVWIVEPLGHGLDAKAVAAVRTYKFEPANYKGKAVGVLLRIEINSKNLLSYAATAARSAGG
jgi:TonB family protein